MAHQLAACSSGLVAGILGLTNLTGFALYLLTSLLSALTIASLKCGLDVSRYVAQAHGSGGSGVVRWKGWLALFGMGQENLLGFLLFWIGSYALIHGEFGCFANETELTGWVKCMINEAGMPAIFMQCSNNAAACLRAFCAAFHDGITCGLCDLGSLPGTYLTTFRARRS